MFKNFSTLVLATCFITLFGCSAMNPKAIDSVQTVAFVGFDIDTNPASFPTSKGSAQLAHELQSTVKQSFSQKLGWNITKSDELTQNPVYHDFFKEYKSLFMQGGLVEDGQLRKAEADRLDFKEREQLMSALDVDALAMIRLTMPLREVQNNNGEVIEYYDVMVNFSLYKKGNEDTIWQTNTTKAASKIPLKYVAQTHATQAASMPDLTDSIKTMDVDSMFATIQTSEDQDRLMLHERSPENKAKKQEIFVDAMSLAFNEFISEYQNAPKK